MTADERDDEPNRRDAEAAQHDIDVQVLLRDALQQRRDRATEDRNVQAELVESALDRVQSGADRFDAREDRAQS